MNFLFIMAIFFAIYIVGAIFIFTRHTITGEQKWSLVLSLFSIGIVIASVYNIYMTDKNQQIAEKEKLVYNYVKNLDDFLIVPEMKLLDNYPEGIFLYSEMNPDSDIKDNLPDTYDTNKRKVIESIFASYFFSEIDNYFKIASIDPTNKLFWYGQFIQWLRSSTLQRQWNNDKLSYSPETQKKIDQMISLANTINKRMTKYDYEMLARKILD